MLCPRCACDQGGEENDATQLDHHSGGQRPVDAVGCGYGLADIMDARADPTTEVAWVEPKGSPKGGEQHDGNTAAQSDKRDRHCGVILVRAGDLGHRGDRGRSADGEARRNQQRAGRRDAE